MSTKRKPLTGELAVLRGAIVIHALNERGIIQVCGRDNMRYYARTKLAAFRQVLRMINFRRKLP